MENPLNIEWKNLLSNENVRLYGLILSSRLQLRDRLACICPDPALGTLNSACIPVGEWLRLKRAKTALHSPSLIRRQAISSQVVGHLGNASPGTPSGLVPTTTHHLFCLLHQKSPTIPHHLCISHQRVPRHSFRLMAQEPTNTSTLSVAQLIAIHSRGRLFVHPLLWTAQLLNPSRCHFLDFGTIPIAPPPPSSPPSRASNHDDTNELQGYLKSIAAMPICRVVSPHARAPRRDSGS